MAIAEIRPYVASDRKLVLLKVGKSNMEGLAVANNRSRVFFMLTSLCFLLISKAYLHPLTLGVWLAFTAAFIHLMNWWPSNHHGFWSYLAPVPAFAATAVPVMAVVDWFAPTFFLKAIDICIYVKQDQ